MTTPATATVTEQMQVLEAENARLKAVNTEMENDWKGTISALNLADEELKSIWDCLGDDFIDGDGIGKNCVRVLNKLRADLVAARKDAANARREAKRDACQPTCEACRKCR